VTLAELNALPESEARAALLKCCGAKKWAAEMIAARPFASFDELLQTADSVADRLNDQDWLEAFAAHPRIGEASASAWSQTEQAAVLNAEDVVQKKLMHANKEYETKFGFIFIVFASGKTPEQVLQLIEQRGSNDRRTEIANAVAEQRKITRNRLHKLVET
jgi:2-oxo-4-hydroxy-4-carboxy-5-ureidoimidazoline decarboxylase